MTQTQWNLLGAAATVLMVAYLVLRFIVISAPESGDE